MSKHGPTLAQLADDALARGLIPCSLSHDELLTLHFVPLHDARAFLIAHPGEPLTWRNYTHWKVQRLLRELGPAQTYTNAKRIEVAA